MPFAAALSTQRDTARALNEATSQAREQLGCDPDLAVVFFSTQHILEEQSILEIIVSRFSESCVIGCSGEAIVGNDREIERTPGVSVWLARWEANVALEPFRLTLEETADGPSLLGWPDGLLAADTSQGTLLLLADPFSFPIDECLRQINDDHARIQVIGGMASGGREPHDNRLLLGDEFYSDGAVGMLLPPAIKVRAVVSQGCRPVGMPLVVTRARGNIIEELGGQAPFLRLQQIWRELSPADQDLFQQGLHIGRVINEYQGEFRRGDFLIRNVLALDRDSGALAVGDHVRVGQTVQFHVRDATTADEDLHSILRSDQSAHIGRPAGALLFTCNGRGTRFFRQPNHDAGAIRTEVGPLPLAGFFAQGEIGPIGGQNFVHGFTASVALFE